MRRILSRRQAHIGVLALFIGFAGIDAEGGDVKLLLIRDADYAGRCTQCIPGRLYGIPPEQDLTAAEWTTWSLEKIADTIELGYEDNIPFHSSIPPGVYSATVRTDPTKSWMKQTRNGVNLAWRLELKGDLLEGRAGIQFHYGKDVKWSEGCIILGHNASSVCQEECRFSDSPVNGLRALRDYVEARLTASDDTITVRVADNPYLP